MIGAWRTRQEDLATATARREAIRLAKRVTACDEDLAANRREITALVAASDGAAQFDEPGIGAINAAVIIGRTSGGCAPKPRSRCSLV
ncbi:hypothetical protein [Microbacterium sp. A93]|uniref:hypothetical protein n=1 Tax=Microbacterium sp. A93 TaxID=3450716 RepID=UPI003F437E74